MKSLRRTASCISIIIILMVWLAPVVAQAFQEACSCCVKTECQCSCRVKKQISGDKELSKKNDCNCLTPEKKGNGTTLLHNSFLFPTVKNQVFALFKDSLQDRDSFQKQSRSELLYNSHHLKLTPLFLQHSAFLL